MDFELLPIFPISALQKRLGEVKEAAQKGPVRITENGVGAYLFMSEEAYEMLIEQVEAETALEVHMAQGIAAGRADIAAGRFIEGTEAAFAEIRRRHNG